MNYNVELKINNVDYSEYIQLPFSITETLDETMDTGVKTLNFMTERAPFKPYSECEITLTQPDNVPKKHIMLLESDRVEEVQHGNDSYWKHYLTFVELTHLLSNYYLADCTITQPITAFAFPKAVPTVTEGSFDTELYYYREWLVFINKYHICNLELTDISYSVKTKYGGTFSLENSVARNFSVNYTLRRVGIETFVENTTTYYGNKVTYKFYYKLHSGSTWTEISDISSVTLAVGKYDIKAVSQPLIAHYRDWRGNDLTKTIDIENVILYKNIEVAASITEADVFTIKEGIEKVLSGAKLEEIGEDYDFITLSAEAITKYNLDNLKCPEMTITNNRNLLEVFYDIGKEFNAYPRLIKDNGYKLTFDLLENPRDNSTYEDGDELEIEESNMTNYANILVSNVANMTSSETTKIYPGVGAYERWISCRADPNDITLKKENMSILVDDNINYLVKVKVKNWKTADLSDEQEITGYIFEKTIYDSLNKNIGGQGLALYYEKGKNKIVGLGYLPQIQSYISLGSTDYIIQRILTDITAVAKENQEDALNFLYQVEYVPYINARVLTHQANIADFDKDYQANYNQETANINAEAFGKDTQKTISRIGNNNVNNLARVESISQIPYTGEHKQIDGVDYFANVVTTTFNNNSITVALEYSKDYNKINNRVGIDKEYREFSLYADSFVNRTVNIEDFCEVSIKDVETPPSYTFDKIKGLAAIYHNLLKVQFIYKKGEFKLACFKANGTTKLQYTPFNESTPVDLNEFIIPTTCNILGNSVVLVGSCYDNYSVGQYIDGTYAFGSCANKDARYVDDVGELPVAELTFAPIDELTNSSLDGAKSFPIPTTTTDPTHYMFLNRKFKVNKDNRERLIFAYSLNWFTKQKELKIHNGAMKYLFDSRADTPTKIGNVILIGFTGDVKNKDIINYTVNDILNDSTDLTYDGEEVYDGYFHITTTAKTPTKNYTGFALIWQNTGELLYSFKQPLTAGVELPSKHIYFNFTNKKH